MKQFIKSMLIMLCMLVGTTTAFAQTNNHQQRLSREQLAQVQAKRIAAELKLNKAKTDRLVKTYCACQREIWALGKRLTPRAGRSEVKERFARSQNILDIREKYYDEYCKFLTDEQIEQMYRIEHRMMKRMADRAHRKHPRQ